jgi:galactosamine-6-phosphate isomerase
LLKLRRDEEGYGAHSNNMVNIKVLKNFELMSQKAVAEIVKVIKKKPKAVISIATGATPARTYELLALEYQKDPSIFGQIYIVKLDEWGGVPLSDLATCETEIREKIIKPLHISEDRYITFDNNAELMEKSLADYQRRIDEIGPIDICILGLGRNGHLGLNDPDESLELEAHVADHLSEQTLHHAMTLKTTGHITLGLTLGLRSIFEAKKVLFLVNGAHKKDIFAKFKEQKISTKNPASLLWLHRNVLCLCDKEADGL